VIGKIISVHESTRRKHEYYKSIINTRSCKMKFGFEEIGNDTKTFGYGRKAPQRFWMKKGESKEIVFIDDIPASINEHSLKVDGKWRNYTCLGAMCPLCDIPRFQES
jgi:hypothetical protein